MAKHKEVLSSPELKDDIDEIAKYDPELRFRRLSGIALKLMYAMTLILSIFHIYTAGFGVLQEWRHRTFHLAFVLPLVFFLYYHEEEQRKERNTSSTTSSTASPAAPLITTMCRELFSLSSDPPPSWHWRPSCLCSTSSDGSTSRTGSPSGSISRSSRQ